MGAHGQRGDLAQTCYRAGVDIRPYTSADAPAIVSFLASCHALDETIVAVAAPTWASFTAMSFNRGARDFALLETAGGEIAALLMSTRYPDGEATLRNFRIIVHPEQRRQGLGSRVLAYVVAQDPAGDTTLQCSAPGAWVAGSAFLQGNGFTSMNLDLEMCRRGAPPPAFEPPAPYTLRPYNATTSDDEAWRALHTDGYAGTHGFQPMTADDPAAGRSAPDFHMWFAEEGSAVCGLCETSATADGTAGLVESVVVESQHRGNGLGRALVVAGLRTLAGQGYDSVNLGVFDVNVAAKRLYESLGFKTFAETHTWRRP